MPLKKKKEDIELPLEIRVGEDVESYFKAKYGNLWCKAMGEVLKQYVAKRHLLEWREDC